MIIEGFLGFVFGMMLLFMFMWTVVFFDKRAEKKRYGAFYWYWSNKIMRIPSKEIVFKIGL